MALLATRPRKGLSTFVVLATVCLFSFEACGRSRITAVIHTTSDEPGSEAWLNPHLSGLKMWKDEKNDTIIIKVHQDGWPDNASSARFLVRLFDKNGHYLTTITSEPLSQVFSTVGRVPNDIELTFPMNSSGLKEVEQAEFGGLF